MKRWLLVFVISLFAIALLTLSIATSRATLSKNNAQKSASFTVDVKPWGPSQEMLDEAKARLEKHVSRYAGNARSRLVAFELVAEDDKPKSALKPLSRYRRLLANDEKTDSDPQPPSRYRGTFYDYTNNLAIVAESSFNSPEVVNVTTGVWQPLPSAEEFDDAIEILRQDPKLGPALVDKRLDTYPPMPANYIPAKTKGRIDRMINIGLLAKDRADKTLERTHEVVAVNLSQRTVVRFADGAPPTSRATLAACGPGSGGSSTGRGLAGSYQFTISDAGGTQLWSFVANRPSSSSGSEGSGIDIQNVKYKGQLVLKRAHVPILNILYDGNTCGPYRDWQYAESQFDADPISGTTVAPGVRSCTVPATTQLESGVDTGNHQGIAYYTQGDAVVLVSEMSAGWYRYITEYGFHANGTISPRYGMGATSNSCTCNGHVHHAYWRFDFDIGGTTANQIFEYPNGTSRPVPLGGQILTEAKHYRTKAMTWLIRNSQTNASYQIIPGANDGTALGDSYGRADVWFLTYSASEFDDSAVRTNTEANIDAFVSPKITLENQDVVIWYAIHIPHNRAGSQVMGHPHSITGQYVAGPDLVPYRW